MCQGKFGTLNWRKVLEMKMIFRAAEIWSYRTTCLVGTCPSPQDLYPDLDKKKH